MSSYRRYLSCFLIFISFFCIFASVINLNNEGKIICIPNSTFHIDCNRCKCSASGTSVDCTDWSCAILTIPHDILLNVTLNCKADEIFLYNHYKCLCCDSETCALCTSAFYELAHNLQPAAGSILSFSNSLEKCTPGIVFKNGCDTCICDENGNEAACLGLRCSDDLLTTYREGDDSNELRDKLCLPYSTFSIDCNQCTCSRDGYSYSCDNYPCLGVEMRDDQFLNITFACNAGSTFLYNRHECQCSSNGNWATCSLALRDKTEEFRSSGKKVVSIVEFPELCTPGMTFKDACNICICSSKEKAVCTKLDCEFGEIGRSNDIADGSVVVKEDIWVQKIKNRRFCNKNYASMYCRFMQNY